MPGSNVREPRDGGPGALGQPRRLEPVAAAVGDHPPALEEEVAHTGRRPREQESRRVPASRRGEVFHFPDRDIGP